MCCQHKQAIRQCPSIKAVPVIADPAVCVLLICTVQVVIRVRPPLPRELQGFTEYQCTSLVDARSGQLITISENLPAVLSGQGASDGMLYATYRCAPLARASSGQQTAYCFGTEHCFNLRDRRELT